MFVHGSCCFGSYLQLPVLGGHHNPREGGGAPPLRQTVPLSSIICLNGRFRLRSFYRQIFTLPTLYAGDLAIVVNKNSSLNDISSAELTKFFRAEKSKTPDGVKLVVLMQEVGRSERAAALQEIFKMSEGEYSKYFLQATFTGLVVAAPKALPNSQAVIKAVSETPGGIGYVNKSDVTDAVKVLKIDGK